MHAFDLKASERPEYEAQWGNAFSCLRKISNGIEDDIEDGEVNFDCYCKHS